MESVTNATARLEQALARLEAAAQTLVAGRAGAAEADREIEALKADRDRLGRALAELQQKYSDLRAVSDAVASRLDSTIGRVRGALSG